MPTLPMLVDLLQSRIVKDSEPLKSEPPPAIQELTLTLNDSLSISVLCNEMTRDFIRKVRSTRIEVS